MEISCLHHFIGQLSPVGEQKKALRILVQPSCIVYPDRIVHIRDHVIFNLCICSAFHPFRLVKCKKDFLLRWFNFFPVYLYYTGILYLHTGHRFYLIHFHPSGFDETVCLPAGTDPRITEIFIQTHILCPSCYLMKFYYTTKQGAKRAFMLIWRLPAILAVCG